MSVAERIVPEDKRTHVPRLRSMTTGKATVMANVHESPLSFYFDQGVLTMVQHEAGERFRQDWEMAAVGSDRALDLTRPPGSSGQSITDHQADALQRVSEALHAAGKIGGSIVINVCGDGHWASDVGRSFGWPSRYATQRLKEALDDLAVHYGLMTSAGFHRITERK